MPKSKFIKHAFRTGVIASCFASLPAFATPPSTAASTPAESSDDTGKASEPESGQNASQGMLGSLGRVGYLLGDMGGLRPLLGDAGMSLNIVETSEILGNVSGGVKQGFVYDGLTQGDLQLDTQRAFGLYGGTFNVSALYVHGSNLSEDNLGTIQTASGIEADRSLRLWELWYQQKFLDGRADIKVGEQSADQEFIVSSNAGLFVNTMFGWPVLPSYDLPGGGPAYPLAAPAVRLRVKPTDSVTFLAAAFNGTPVLNASGDPQAQNLSGTSFPLGNGVLAFSEVQYEFPANGGMVHEGDADVLPGVYKLGAWYDSENFADQELDSSGLALANPAGTGNPLQHQGDYSFYAVADQTIWRSDELNEDEKSVSFFARIMGAPPDRNFITFSLNGGFTLKDPLEGRDDDTAGIGMGYAKVSNQTGNADADTAFYTGMPNLVRHTETYVEATYQYQVFPWWQLQPDFQYVFDPGAGASNPNNPAQKTGNEAVIGLRTNITF
jgi:porin